MADISGPEFVFDIDQNYNNIKETFDEIKKESITINDKIIKQLESKGSYNVSDAEISKQDLIPLIDKSQKLLYTLEPFLDHRMDTYTKFTRNYGNYDASDNDKNEMLCFVTGIKIGMLASDLKNLIDLENIDDISTYDVPNFIVNEVMKNIDPVEKSLSNCNLFKQEGYKGISFQYPMEE